MTSPAVFTPNGTAATNVARFTQSVRRVTLSDPPIAGWEEIKVRLDELSRLETGWDGYQGVAMRFEIGYFAAEIIKNLCCLSVPYMPEIIPGSNGDVQIEWHSNGRSIELHVQAPYNVTAWRNNDEAGEDGEEVQLATDFTVISKWLEEFTKALPTNAATAA